jgi:DNA-binding transcriptional LysR family regulator
MPRTPTRRYFKELRFQQLQGFCETARSGGFAVAAETLGLSRPALWHQIRALELELGADLVRRSGRGIEVTPDGTLLLELAEPLVTGFAQLKSRFHERRGAIERHLTLASTASLLAHELREPLCRFRARHADVHLTLLDRMPLESARLVETGEVDLAVVGRCDAEPLSALVTCEPLFTEPFVLVCPRDHELARRHRLQLDESRNARLEGIAVSRVAVGLRVSPRHQRKTARLARWRRGVCVSKPHAALGQGIHVRSDTRDRTPETAQRFGIVIVGRDDDEICLAYAVGRIVGP